MGDCLGPWALVAWRGLGTTQLVGKGAGKLGVIFETSAFLISRPFFPDIQPQVELSI